MLLAEIADTEELRQRGLMFRHIMPADQAMLFDFERLTLGAKTQNRVFALFLWSILRGSKKVGKKKFKKDATIFKKKKQHLEHSSLMTNFVVQSFFMA